MSSDDDEDDFAIYGTPLEEIDEDTLPRKKPTQVENQTAKDEHGRRRFHGAFTGGFTAGFFNTVGSLEGWTPSSFRSSRDNKLQCKPQNVQDFMDDEDKGEFGICPMALKIKPTFESNASRKSKRERYELPSSSSISGILNVKDILQPVVETVGIKLLMRMGWKPGQGVGPRLNTEEKLNMKKICGCNLPNRKQGYTNDDEGEEDTLEGLSDSITFAPDEYSLTVPHPKHNTFGLGYVGISRNPVLTSNKQRYSQLTLQGKSIHGQAFGVGAYEEEDEDIYATDDMSQYDFSLGGPATDKKSMEDKNRLDRNSGSCIQGFHVVPEQHYHEEEIFPFIKVPADFVPIHRFKKSRFDDSKDPKRIHKSISNVEERSLVLGNVFPEAKKQSLPAKEDDKSNLEITSQPVKETQEIVPSSNTSDQKLPVPCGDSSSSSSTSSSSFKPFSSNPEKQERYERFLSSVKSKNNDNNKEFLSSIQPATMTDWERVREKLEFEKAAKLFNSVSSDLSTRFTGGKLLDDVSTAQEAPLPKIKEDDDTRTRRGAAEKEMYGFLTRREYKFVPCKLLCQRFNVPEPAIRDDLELCPDTIRKSKQPGKGIFSILEWEAFSKVETRSYGAEEKSENKLSTSIISDNIVTEKTEVEVDIIPDTDNKIDLFKAVFLDSSDDEAEAETGNVTEKKEPTMCISSTKMGELLSISESKHLDVKKFTQDILLAPATGIFANLNLDELKGNSNQRQNANEEIVAETNTSLDGKNGDVTDKKTVNNGDVEDDDKCEHYSCYSADSYGPVLPVSLITTSHRTTAVNADKASTGGESSSSDEEWIEKSSKHKKKKKQKHKKHKSKRTKNKRRK